jgi:hypothetical protein
MLYVSKRLAPKAGKLPMHDVAAVQLRRMFTGPVLMHKRIFNLVVCCYFQLAFCKLLSTKGQEQFDLPHRDVVRNQPAWCLDHQ